MRLPFSLCDRLTKPHESIQDVEDRKKARLTAAFALVNLLLTITFLSAVLVVDPNLDTFSAVWFYVGSAVIPIHLMSYLFSRSRRPAISAYLPLQCQLAQNELKCVCQ